MSEMTHKRGRFSFPKSKRILKKLEYKAVLGSSSKAVTKELVVIAKPADHPRLGLIVSKKVGNAVSRNLVKRRVREVYRQIENPPHLEVVVIARWHAAKASYDSIELALVRGLKKIDRGLEARHDSKRMESKPKL